MTVRLYKSTDSSAPGLTGQVGSLVSLLDAVLVNGYGSQTAAGWTKPYTATNKAVFRNSSSTGTGFYLDVDDSAPSTAKEARVRGYETMSAVATGTGPFPTVAQMANGLFARKSTTADGTARPWYILADETVFYLFVETGDYTGPTRTCAFSFGDFYSFKTSDAYRCMIIARTTENSSSPNAEAFPAISQSGQAQVMNITLAGHYMARGTAGTGGSIAFGTHTNASPAGHTSGYMSAMGASVSSGGPGSNAGVYPNPADSGLYMAPVYLHHTNGLRGYMKGIWSPLHDMPLGHTDTISGTGSMSSKSFLCMQMLTNMDSNTNKPAECLLETTDTWS